MKGPTPPSESSISVTTSKKAGEKIDLMQIYPSTTNHLNFITYSMNSKQLLFENKLIRIPLSSTMSILRGILFCMILVSLAALIGFIIDIITFYKDSYLAVLLVFNVFVIGTLCSKGYLLFQVNEFIRKANKRSIDFHEYGMRIFYALHVDIMFSFLMTLSSITFCFRACNYIFDDKINCYNLWSFDIVFFSIVFWCFSVPLFIYSIFALLILFKMPLFFQQFSYKMYLKSKDAKYCMYYHHCTEPISGRCVCCAVELNFTASGGIKLISVWFVLISLLSLFGAIYILHGMIVGTFDICVLNIMFVFVGIISSFVHGVAATYGIKARHWNNIDGIEYHKNIQRCFTYFSLSGGISFMTFLIWGCYWLFYGIMESSDSHHSKKSLFAVFLVLLGLYIAYLPFEAIQLLDKYVKKDSYLVRSQPDSIKIDKIIFKIVPKKDDKKKNLKAKIESETVEEH